MLWIWTWSIRQGTMNLLILLHFSSAIIITLYWKVSLGRWSGEHEECVILLIAILYQEWAATGADGRRVSRCRESLHWSGGQARTRLPEMVRGHGMPTHPLYQIHSSLMLRCVCSHVLPVSWTMREKTSKYYFSTSPMYLLQFPEVTELPGARDEPGQFGTWW